MIEGTVKLVAPLVVTFGIGWAVRYAARRGFHAATSDQDYAGG